VKATITTTITTFVDVETFDTTHEVGIHPDGSLPEVVVVAAVTGACKSVLQSLEQHAYTRIVEPKE
jgi:hypothetical protein